MVSLTADSSSFPCINIHLTPPTKQSLSLSPSVSLSKYFNQENLSLLKPQALTHNDSQQHSGNTSLSMFPFLCLLLRKWTIWNGNGNGVLGFIVLVVLVLSQLVIRTGKSWWVIHFFEFLKCLKVKDSILLLISFVSLNLISGKTKELKSEYKIKASNVSFLYSVSTCSATKLANLISYMYVIVYKLNN